MLRDGFLTRTGQHDIVLILFYHFKTLNILYITRADEYLKNKEVDQRYVLLYVACDQLFLHILENFKRQYLLCKYLASERALIIYNATVLKAKLPRLLL